MNESGLQTCKEEPAMPRILSRRFLFAALTIELFASPTLTHAQFFTVPGSFSYAFIERRQVFDVNSAGTLGIVLRNSPGAPDIPLLSTFNAETAVLLDSQSEGFGPLGVRLAQIPQGLRAVMLTSQGGARSIFLYSVEPTGLLARITQTQLTPSLADGGSHLVVSPMSQAGFALVQGGAGPGKELVSFSLVNGSILGRLPIGPTATFEDAMAMVEIPDGRRLLAYFNQTNSVAIVDASNVALPVVLGTIPLPSVSLTEGMPQGVVFSRDGRYLFASNGFSDLSAIAVSTMSVVGSLGGTLRFGPLEATQGPYGTQLAALSRIGTTSTYTVSLVDANDPAHLVVVRQYSDSLPSKSPMAFSQDGKRLYVGKGNSVAILNLPTLQQLRLVALPPMSVQPQQVMVAGPRVFAAWGASAVQSFLMAYVKPEPACSISLSKPMYGDSEQVLATSLRMSNPLATPVAVEFKFWLDIPGFSPATFSQGGADSSLNLPAYYNQEFGPIPLFEVNASLPRGTYAFNCRLMDPVNGDVLGEDLNPFTVF
jgi:DNA-binding beta-propeller fold protein YncE